MNQTQKKTFGRVADAILYFSKIIFEANEFEIPFTRQEFADLIGVSRESATRVLSELDSDGIVSLKNRAISILNLEKLMQVSRNG
jgi:CRP-like cAMP-binding protein